MITTFINHRGQSVKIPAILLTLKYGDKLPIVNRIDKQLSNFNTPDMAKVKTDSDRVLKLKTHGATPSLTEIIVKTLVENRGLTDAGGNRIVIGYEDIKTMFDVLDINKLVNIVSLKNAFTSVTTKSRDPWTRQMSVGTYKILSQFRVVKVPIDRGLRGRRLIALRLA